MNKSQQNRNIPKPRGIGFFTYLFILFILTVGIVAIMQAYKLDEEIVTTQFAFTFLVLAFGADLLFGQRSKNAWEKFAKQMGFYYRLESTGVPFFKTPVISADYRGRSIRINLFDAPSSTQRSGGVVPTYTEIIVTFSGGEIGKNNLELQRKKFFTPREKLIYEPGDEHLLEFQTENDNLNRLCWVRTSSETFASQLLEDISIQQRLGEMVENTREMKLTLRNKRLRFYQPGKISDMAYLHAVLDLLVDMAIKAEKIVRPRVTKED